jgi:hypothetical protein
VKLTRIAAFAAGYVLGSKAGRERYEQIVAAARKAAARLENYGNGASWSQDRPAVDTSEGDSGQQ